VLAASSGKTEAETASALNINRKTVRLWRDRFTREDLQGLWEIAPGRGRKPTYGLDRIKSVIDTTLQSKPKGSTHWSCRTLAADQGVSKSTVSNILRSHNLKPHRTKTFKLSRDPRFLEKLTDVVGLYLNPPDKAIVLCVDEKSQIQALNRTQPGLPLKKGRCGTMTHDYKRNGKTHAALALGLAARQRGHRVRFTTTAALVGELIEARDDKKLFRFQPGPPASGLCLLGWEKQIASYELLIVDEQGFVPLSKTGAELFFEMLSQRYERGSTMVTSNLPFQEWTEVLGSERLTGALLDRLTHHVHILEMNGDSYRLKQSRRKRTPSSER
jgi:transcriptional regulator with XRE-family HTH domain